MLFFGQNKFFGLFCPKFVLFFGQFIVNFYTPKLLFPIYDIVTNLWFMFVD